MHEILMPKLGNTVETVIITEWRKEVGEKVNIGEVLCEVETDKSTMEVEAEEAGILLARLFDVGDEVPVLSRFAILGEEGEDVSTHVKKRNANQPADSGRQTNEPGTPRVSKKPDSEANESTHLDISPRARKLAFRAGLNTNSFASSAKGDALGASTTNLNASSIFGSGPRGRIIERDVKYALARIQRSDVDFEIGGNGATSDVDKSAQSHTTTSTSYTKRETAGSSEKSKEHGGKGQGEFPDAFEAITMRMQRDVRMENSLGGSAQLTLNRSAPAASILKWRLSFKHSSTKRQDASIGHLLMYVVARVLPYHPGFNATLDGNEMREHANVHLGFRVDTPEGLKTPVIRNANKSNLDSLTSEARRLADSCKKGDISPDELVGSTFTVINLGSLGIESFIPALEAPQVAILGIGTITNAPIEIENGIGIEKRIGLSLSIDHRVLDGASGARFLDHLVRILTKLELAALL